ncbi:MAG: Rpn family recombination-promoting nuclease/putative transposase [Lachnospiraceae bacterium]|nr:Rpn family recombination-promoting nuclease/putative transposase [Lachnospiraceae bacterium]
MNKMNTKQQINGTHFTKDINGRVVFQDPIMCSQFLKDYSGMDIFKDVRPEDIIDETKKYQAYLGITFESDTVNRIVLNGITDVPVFVVSLIEHKSDVDYNVAMQLLRYMVCIWTEYGKERLARGDGNPCNKRFRYPPIIPIVYYEGKARWTAGLNLKDRISMSEVFAEYIPDFSYKIICNYNYTNDELLAKEDEISLFMILNKVQTAEDMSELLRLDDSKLNEILRKSPKQTLKIIADAMWSLCMKLNVPQDEAVDYVGKVWNRDMGYLFENIEKMDIQEERRKTKEAREELVKTKAELEEAKKEIQTLKDQLNKKN